MDYSIFRMVQAEQFYAIIPGVFSKLVNLVP